MDPRDKMHLVNCLFRCIFQHDCVNALPGTAVIQLPVAEEDIEFYIAHKLLRGYHGKIDGVGKFQILEQNTLKWSWPAIMAKKHGFQIAWIWINNQYKSMCVWHKAWDVREMNTIIIDASQGPTKCKEFFKANPWVKGVIDANNEIEGHKARTWRERAEQGRLD